MSKLSVRWEGDTSKWDARKQMREALKVIKLLEAIDINMNGKKTITWRITEMSKVG